MKMNRRFCAMALTFGMAATPIVPVFAQPISGITGIQDRDHDRDDRDRDRDRDGDRDRDRDRDHDRDHDRDNQWANNKYYKMGMKDADHDRRHNRRDRRHRNFKHDDDRRAYEAGYNATWPR